VTLEAGKNLLHYRLVEKLGEGGMGVVWKANDTTLDREVAIKVLPQAFASDPERLARFEREARMLASLNHTHIATVYSVHQEGELRFLAMEFVDGEDLAARIGRGPLPVDEAAVIGAQIADALECAHDGGMIHRDLKPANVMLNLAGQVKVLDFGLAKIFEPTATSEADLSHSPTMTSAGTIAGVILGTAGYMSPEQARGQAIDRRADIWAFGCVMFEMLTGAQLYRGGTVSDTLAGILTRDPDWSLLPDRLPASLRTLLARCLCKDARNRLRDIGEARITLSSVDDVEPTPVAPQRRAPERALGLIVILLLAAALAWVGLRETPSTTGDGALDARWTRLTDLPGAERNPGLSPDGRMLLYDNAGTGNQDVYLMRVGGARAINLTENSKVDDSQAVFSPDGDRIAFRSEREGGGLFVMGATGESVRRVTDGGYNPAWSPDAKRLAYATEAVDDPYSRSVRSELWVVEFGDGTTTRLSAGDAVQPVWSPDGRRIAYWSNTGGQRDIWTIDSGGNDPAPVTEDAHTDWSPAWSPDGAWLYFSSDRGGSMNLWRTRFDSEAGRAVGEPQRVTSGVQAVGHAAVAADGRTMVLMAYDRSAEIGLHRLDPRDACKITSSTILRQAATWCSISPDAGWLACTLRGAQEEIVLIRSDGSEVRRLTDHPAKDRFATWSPDGTELIFYSNRSGDWEQWGIRIDGSGLRQITDLGEISGGAWSPDGRRLAVNADYYAELWVVDSDRLSTRQDGRRLPLPIPAFQVHAWSPDGRKLAGVEVGEDGGGIAFGVYDLESETYRRLELEHRRAGSGSVIAWLPDGDRLVVDTTEQIVVFDARDSAVCEILPSHPGNLVGLSESHRVLQVEREVVNSEIWMLSLGE
jgi:Tol biopolymer transport system component